MKKTGRIQILKHMRNLFLFILLSASSVWAKGSYSQETQLKLNVKNGTLESIFNQITRQSQLEFFYNTNALDVKQKVDLSKKTGTLDEILKEILGDKYRYRIKDQYILISEVEPEMQAEKKSVTINVRDRKGAVIPGVTVLLKGTTLGTATDMNGEFKITVPEQPEIILQFSFIGMKNKDVEYKGEPALKIVLEEDVAEMEEVIVTGIFTRKAESYTGAAVTVTQDQLKRVGNQRQLHEQAQSPPVYSGRIRGERRENFRYGYEPGGECDYPERCFCQGLVWFQSSQWGGGYRDQTFVIRTAEGDL